MVIFLELFVGGGGNIVFLQIKQNALMSLSSFYIILPRPSFFLATLTLILAVNMYNVHVHNSLFKSTILEYHVTCGNHVI